MLGNPRLLRTPLLLAVATAVALVGAPVSATAATPAAATTQATSGFQGTAFATSVSVGSTVKSGKTSLLSYGCGTGPGYSKTLSAAGINVPSLASTGTLATTGMTSAGPDTSTTSATAQNVNLLNGTITATAVTSVSTTTKTANGYAVSDTGTTFTGLKVLGLPVDITTAPNTRINLPLIGFVVINQQRSMVGPNSAGLAVTALHVTVNSLNLLGFPVGTDIVVASASSGLSAPAAGALGGFAYGTQVNVSRLVTSSKTFPVSLGCAGTDGVVKDNTGVGVSVPGVLSSGTIIDTVVGTTSSTSVSGEATSTVESVSLLGGLVQATGLVSDAHAARTGGVTTTGDAGSRFASITVDGVPLVVADIAPNTTINLLGVGTVTLRKTITTATSIEVRMIELKVTVAGNLLGLAVGTTVQVAVANASAR